MSAKYKTVRKKTMNMLAIAGTIVLLIAAAYVGIAMFVDSVSADRERVYQERSADQAMLDNLRSQVDKSGEAEKRFIAMQEARTNPDYEIKRDKLVEFLEEARRRYRFSPPQFTPTPEEVTKKPELLNYSHNIIFRPRVKLELDAVSDAHVFSLIEEMHRSLAGIVRIEKLELTRKGDMQNEVLQRLSDGESPLLVGAVIEFTWIGIATKTDPKNPGNP